MRKILNIGKLSSSQWWAQVFWNSFFSLESSNFIISRKYCVFFLEAINSLCSFLWNHLPDTFPNTMICLSVILSSKNDVPWKKWLVQFTTHTNTQILYFFLETVILLQKWVCCKSVLCVIPILWQNFRKKRPVFHQGPSLSDLLFFLIETQCLLMQLSDSALIRAKAPVLPTALYCDENVTTIRKY